MNYATRAEGDLSRRINALVTPTVLPFIPLTGQGAVKLDDAQGDRELVLAGARS